MTLSQTGVSNITTLPDLYGVLSQHHLEPLWTMEGALTPEPTTNMVPFVWPYDEVRAFMLRSGELISAEDAERRVLALRNPGTADHEVARATDTLWAAIQMVLPGEIAPAHRHTPSALRYIIEGSGAFTAVDGRRCDMEIGDFVITPNWAWHEHGHEGQGPMLWLDGLDLAIVHAMHAVFAEGQDAPIPAQPTPPAPVRSGFLRPRWAGDHAAPTLTWKLDDARSALASLRDSDGSPYDGVILEYSDPATGGAALTTMSACLQLLRPGESTRAHRHTWSAVYHVVEGSGHSIVDGHRLNWGPNDTFAIPTWARHEHHNAAGRDALLFSFSDAPAVTALGLAREIDD
jgi:gentisate 1,2-dioxygenase